MNKDIVNRHSANYRRYIRAANNAQRIGNFTAASEFLRRALASRNVGRALNIRCDVAPPVDPDTCKMKIEPGTTYPTMQGKRTEFRTYGRRCLLKKPPHWPANASAINWLGAGGDTTVFGHCTPSRCPKSHCV